ncbi:MAG: hypothetical protein KBH86_08460 [Syntrophorhabdus sp.]|nr:hypothetical protein [Syntrophorhabdus sp.]
MIVKLGDKEYIINNKDTAEMGGKSFKVDRIEMYAFYHKERNLYGKKPFIIKRGTSEINLLDNKIVSYDFKRKFKNKQDMEEFKEIIRYRFYYYSADGKLHTPTEPVSTIWINQIGTEKTSQNNSIRNIINNEICIDNGYLPTHEDYENTRRKLLREKKNNITIDDFLNYMQKDIEQRGLKMCRDWRSLTEKNIELWSRNK